MELRFYRKIHSLFISAVYAKILLSHYQHFSGAGVVDIVKQELVLHHFMYKHHLQMFRGRFGQQPGLGYLKVSGYLHPAAV